MTNALSPASPEEQLDGGEQEDGGKGVERRAVGAEIDDAVHIVADDEAEQCDGAGIDDGEARPSEQEGEAAAPCALEEMIVAAGMGEGAGEFGIAERTHQGDEAADDPEEINDTFRAALAATRAGDLKMPAPMTIAMMTTIT